MLMVISSENSVKDTEQSVESNNEIISGEFRKHILLNSILSFISLIFFIAGLASAIYQGAVNPLIESSVSDIIIAVVFLFIGIIIPFILLKLIGRWNKDQIIDFYFSAVAISILLITLAVFLLLQEFINYLLTHPTVLIVFLIVGVASLFISFKMIKKPHFRGSGLLMIVGDMFLSLSLFVLIPEVLM